MNIQSSMPIVRFSVASRSVSMLAANTIKHIANYGASKVYDVQNFRNNAFIFSSLIQVLSRIYVSNNTAKKAAGTPNEGFRYSEAVYTTFREAMGFCLSYLVLRSFQRVSVDAMRNIFCVTQGLPIKPTFFAPLFQALRGGAQRETLLNTAEHFPSALNICKSLGNEIRSFIFGTQKPFHLAEQQAKRFQFIKETVVSPQPLQIDPQLGMQRYRKFEGIITLVNKLAGNSKQDIACKMKTFFDWMPVILASIPTVALSGFWLESYSQRKGESMAQSIAKHFGKNSIPSETKPMNIATSPILPKSASTDEVSFSQVPTHLDSTPNVSYAYQQPMPPVTTTGAWPYVSRPAGYYYPTYTAQYVSPWTAGWYGRGFGPSSPYQKPVSYL